MVHILFLGFYKFYILRYLKFLNHYFNFIDNNNYNNIERKLQIKQTLFFIRY